MYVLYTCVNVHILWKVSNLIHLYRQKPHDVLRHRLAKPDSLAYATQQVHLQSHMLKYQYKSDTTVE